MGNTAQPVVVKRQPIDEVPTSELKSACERMRADASIVAWSWFVVCRGHAANLTLDLNAIETEIMRRIDAGIA